MRAGAGRPERTRVSEIMKKKFKHGGRVGIPTSKNATRVARGRRSDDEHKHVHGGGMALTTILYYYVINPVPSTVPKTAEEAASASTSNPRGAPDAARLSRPGSVHVAPRYRSRPFGLVRPCVPRLTGLLACSLTSFWKA